MLSLLLLPLLNIYIYISKKVQDDINNNNEYLTSFWLDTLACCRMPNDSIFHKFKPYQGIWKERDLIQRIQESHLFFRFSFSFSFRGVIFDFLMVLSAISIVIYTYIIFSNKGFLNFSFFGSTFFFFFGVIWTIKIAYKGDAHRSHVRRTNSLLQRLYIYICRYMYAHAPDFRCFF